MGLPNRPAEAPVEVWQGSLTLVVGTAPQGLLGAQQIAVPEGGGLSTTSSTLQLASAISNLRPSGIRTCFALRHAGRGPERGLGSLGWALKKPNISPNKPVPPGPAPSHPVSPLAVYSRFHLEKWDEMRQGGMPWDVTERTLKVETRVRTPLGLPKSSSAK